MIYTKGEAMALSEIKVTAACRAHPIPPRPWNREDYVAIMASNVAITPIEAARFASDGKYQVAAAMLRHTLQNLEDLMAIEHGLKDVVDGQIVDTELARG